MSKFLMINGAIYNKKEIRKIFVHNGSILIRLKGQGGDVSINFNQEIWDNHIVAQLVGDNHVKD